MTCIDCKNPVEKRSNGAPFICSGCWDLRGKTISMVKSGEMSSASFREIQAAMGRGEGQKAMLLATNPDLYEI